MDIDATPATAAGICDYCGSPINEGDYIASPFNSEVMCDGCITDHRQLHAP